MQSICDINSKVLEMNEFFRAENLELKQKTDTHLQSMPEEQNYSEMLEYHFLLKSQELKFIGMYIVYT